jgi:hypothetical protein
LGGYNYLLLDDWLLIELRLVNWSGNRCNGLGKHWLRENPLRAVAEGVGGPGRTGLEGVVVLRSGKVVLRSGKVVLSSWKESWWLELLLLFRHI